MASEKNQLSRKYQDKFYLEGLFLFFALAEIFYTVPCKAASKKSSDDSPKEEDMMINYIQGAIKVNMQKFLIVFLRM